MWIKYIWNSKETWHLQSKVSRNKEKNKLLEKWTDKNNYYGDEKKVENNKDSDKRIIPIRELIKRC